MSLLVPLEFIGASIERGRAHLRQETDPVRRLELEQLLYNASIRCVPTAVCKLWELGPAPTLREALHQQQRERENAARAAWLEDRERRRYSEVRELYDSLVHGDPKTPRTIPYALAQAHGLLPQALTAMRQEAEEDVREERKELLKREWDYCRSLYREEVEKRQKTKQGEAKCVLESLSEWDIKFFDFFESYHSRDSVIIFLKMYILLLEYPSMQQALKPYYTARFATPWQNEFPKIAKLMPWILEELQHFRQINANSREYIRKQKWAWYKKEPPYAIFYYEMHFENSLLDAFQRFLEEFGEGAFVVLVLLLTVYSPREWRRHKAPDLYPGYNAVYLPTLVNREPLEVLLLLERLAEITSSLKCEVDCAKYYWRADEKQPYDLDPDEYRYYSEPPLVSPFGRAGQFNKELEKRDDLQLLRKEVVRKRDWYLQKMEEGKNWWYTESEDLIRTYLQCRACDIARYGERLADRTFPQPTIKGATPKQVTNIVASLVTVLQEYMRENEELKEKEWFAKSKKRIEDLNRKFDNQIVSMIDFYDRRRQEELYRQERLKEEQEDVTSWQFIRHDITSGVSTFSARNISDPYLLLHHYSAVRKLLTPYFTARFTHPWKVTCTPGYINAILATFRELYDDYNTLSWSLKKPIREEMQAFVQQYGEGALVTFALIHTAYNIRYWRSSSAKYSESYPNKIHSKVYPNLHMSEIPAIAGKEPLQVLTLLKQLNEIMRTIEPHFAVDCASYIHFKSCFDDDGSDDRKAFIKHNAYFHVCDEVKIDLEKREDAQLLIIELQNRQDQLFQQSLSGGALWNSLDELTRTYLVVRACDITRYGVIVANHTYPQPTLEGATKEQVSQLIASLQKAGEQAKLAKKQERLHKDLIVLNEGKIEVTHLPPLPPRILTENEIEEVREACLKELRQSEK